MHNISIKPVKYEKITSKNIKNVKKRKKTLRNKIKCLNRNEKKLRIFNTNPVSGNLTSISFSNKFNIFILKNKNKNYLENSLDNNIFIKKNIIFRHKNEDLCEYTIIFFFLKFKNNYVWFPYYLPQKNKFFTNTNLSFFFFKNIPLYWINYAFIQIYKKWLKKIVKCIYNFIFVKMRYKGKHYRWYRKKKGIVIRFGHSHLIIQKKKNLVFVKKKGKIKLLFFGTNFYLLRSYLKKLTKWKPTNVYTARGIRFSRQRNLRKAGKISIYR